MGGERPKMKPQAYLISSLFGFIAIIDRQHLVELPRHRLSEQNFQRYNASIAPAVVADVNQVNDGSAVASVEVGCWCTGYPDQALHARPLSADGYLDLRRVSRES